ncbi:uncharacterized protein BCR38DRAFT_439325 [Pseudomassariella vexata]|uniref:Uncharacterized protein n=1 Tax=Pseudomassariella vexata TaxID=1141098 RepID=A0A1Y2DTM4_9PEZI|nr:uncharacterized protein BCR38DRAFT_439325 [Pseudomassariella vexata]ORY62631.1 hypothetical protein BCR38DRAFT_439325 [Pseudomassariella vexata]
MASDDSFGTRYPGDPWPGVAPSQQVQIEDRFFVEGASIHFSRLKPLQFWAPFMGVSETARSAFVVKHVVAASTTVNRKLQQSEIDSLSERAAQNARYISLIRPTGLACAVAAAANGRKEFRFPFYTPKASWFDPMLFPSKRLQFLRGTSAVWMWHAVRTFAYYPGTMIATAIIIGSISESTLRANILRDPRLSDLRQATEREGQAAMEKQRALQRRRLGLPDPADRTQQSDQGGAMPTPTPENYQGQPQSRTYPLLPSETTTSGWQDQDNQGSSEPAAPQPQSTPAPSTSKSWGSWGRKPSQQPARPQESSYQQGSSEQSPWEGSGLFEDDDASPVAPSARRTEKAQPSGGSSWDRVRQDAKSKVDARRQASSPGNLWERGDRSDQDTTWGRLRQDAAPEDRDTKLVGSSEKEKYSYNTEEEDKAYAKSQAQKEFDKMLEAERQGRQAESGGWRRSK